MLDMRGRLLRHEDSKDLRQLFGENETLFLSRSPPTQEVETNQESGTVGSYGTSIHHPDLSPLLYQLLEE